MPHDPDSDWILSPEEIAELNSSQQQQKNQRFSFCEINADEVPDDDDDDDDDEDEVIVDQEYFEFFDIREQYIANDFFGSLNNDHQTNSLTNQNLPTTFNPPSLFDEDQYILRLAQRLTHEHFPNEFREASQFFVRLLLEYQRPSQAASYLDHLIRNEDLCFHELEVASELRKQWTEFDYTQTCSLSWLAVLRFMRGFFSTPSPEEMVEILIPLQDHWVYHQAEHGPYFSSFLNGLVESRPYDVQIDDWIHLFVHT